MLDTMCYACSPTQRMARGYREGEPASPLRGTVAAVESAMQTLPVPLSATGRCRLAEPLTTHWGSARRRWPTLVAGALVRGGATLPSSRVCRSPCQLAGAESAARVAARAPGGRKRKRCEGPAQPVPGKGMSAKARTRSQRGRRGVCADSPEEARIASHRAMLPGALVRLNGVTTPYGVA